MKNIHYVSGLPRSGSTLLMNLMAQNPKVFCTPTSGLFQLLHDIKVSWNNIIEHRADKNAGKDDNLKRILNCSLQMYLDTDKEFVLDKCRGWGGGIEMLETITNRKVKIIAPVRDIKEVLASFEVLYRKGSYKFPPQGPMPQCINTEGRMMHWASLNGEVGVAYNILKDAFQRGLGDRFLLVDYDYLTNEPERTMNVIWDFLEIPRCNHDFKNIINQTIEDDGVYNYVDLHKIKSSVIPSKPKAIEILGENLCKITDGYEFWKNLAK
jgi:sulfotransferase